MKSDNGADVVDQADGHEGTDRNAEADGGKLAEASPSRRLSW